MNDSITALLAKLGKPTKRRKVTARLTDADAFALDTYCATNYASYAEVLRDALRAFLNAKK